MILFSILCRSRGSVDPVHRRVRSRQNGEHEEGDPVFGICGRIETEGIRSGKKMVSLCKCAAQENDSLRSNHVFHRGGTGLVTCMFWLKCSKPRNSERERETEKQHS